MESSILQNLNYPLPCHLKFKYEHYLSKIVDKSCFVNEVKAGVSSEAGGIVVVAVDGEDGQPDVEVGGLVVDGLGVAVSVVHKRVGQVLHLDRPIS